MLCIKYDSHASVSFRSGELVPWFISGAAPRKKQIVPSASLLDLIQDPVISVRPIAERPFYPADGCTGSTGFLCDLLVGFLFPQQPGNLQALRYASDFRNCAQILKETVGASANQSADCGFWVQTSLSTYSLQGNFMLYLATIFYNKSPPNTNEKEKASPEGSETIPVNARFGGQQSPQQTCTGCLRS